MHAEGDSERVLTPRLERLRSLRSAWGALAPAGVAHRAEEIAEAGRCLTDHLSRDLKRDDDPTPPELVEIDERLREFEASIRHVATGLKVAQLRSTLPARRTSDRRGLLDLLDVLIGDQPLPEQTSTLPIGSIDYLVTLLCTRPDGVVSADPVTLTPRLQRLCDAAEEADDPRAAEVESEFFAAASMSGDDLREELQLRTLRHRKSELGLCFFAPRVLRAVVTYNSALIERVAGEILEASDWGIVDGEALAPSATRESSVFESEALRSVAHAATRRARGGTPEPTAVDRIAWALDFDYLEDPERKALCSEDLATAADPLGTAILIGLLCRSLAVLSIELQEAGLSPDEIADSWVDELNRVFQQEINAKISSDAYRVACALSELKNKFLLAPLADQFRDERGADRLPVAEPSKRSDGARPNESRKSEKRESARDLVRDALERNRQESAPKRPDWGQLPWSQLARGGTVLAVAAVAVLMLTSSGNPDLSRMSAQELARLSPYLERGHRNGEGVGDAFVGRIDEAWIALPARQREARAVELVSQLREQGVRQIMVYDDAGRLRIQAVGSQPIQTPIPGADG